MLPSFDTIEDLVARVQFLLQGEHFDEALETVACVGEKFAEDPLARHVAGLVHERVFIERSAREGSAPLDLYAIAEGHYREAVQHSDGEEGDLHEERLFAALFVLGTQLPDLDRLREALAIAERLAQSPDDERRGAFLREAGIVATAIARATKSGPDWEDALSRLTVAPEPTLGREAHFHHLYLGQAHRELASRSGDADQMRRACACFRRAMALTSTRPLEFLLADCLASLPKLVGDERAELITLVQGLQQSAGNDPSLAGLQRRLEQAGIDVPPPPSPSGGDS